MLDARLLIIGCTWPEPKSTAAGGRMQRLIQFFIENQCEITFASSANLVESSLNLEALGISKEGILLNDDSFDDFIKKLAPDIVLFDRFLMEEQFGWRVAEHAPNALRILDTEDLHSIRISRETAFKKNLEWNADYWLASDQTKREIASIYRCDFSLIISSFEMQLLKEVLHIASDLLLYLPFMVKDVSKDQIQAWPKYEDRKDFVFIGTGKHAPNIDAIRWLKKDIWPTIKKALPAARLYVCGSYLPDHIRQMQDTKAGFNVVGEVAAEAEIIQSKRINLAPLRFGAGLKGKLLSGMRNGTPNISTTIGAEGMLNDLPWSGLIAS